MDRVSKDYRYTETQTQTETKTKQTQKSKLETLDRQSISVSSAGIFSSAEALTSVAGLGKEEESRAEVGASSSQPESLTGFLVGGFNKNCRRLFDLVMMDLGHSLKNPAAQHRQPCGSMKIRALAAAHVEWRKYHHASQRRCRM
ncbi:hypothetical protein, partial [Mesorhizobium sp.]